MQPTQKYQKLQATTNSLLLSHTEKVVGSALFLQCFDAVGWAAGRASGL